MYSQDDSNILWVCPEDDSSGNGTFKQPFGRIQNALEKALPGQIIVLKDGIYQGDVTIDASGTIDKPLRIVADKDAKVIILESCWYLYDVSDTIISGLTFSHSPLGSIAVIGLCERNRFEYLTFDNCGTSQKASCTVFFGGSGATCNIVEYCAFNRTFVPASSQKQPDDIIVGLMISEGDAREGKPIKNHIIRKNKFSNYDYGILIGSDDTTMKPYGHIVAYNEIDNCTLEGIMVKCGDTFIKGNSITNCKKNSVSVVTGESSIIEDNRIVNCDNGLRISGIGHSIVNNCIVRCKNESIRILGQHSPTALATENIFIEQNSIIGHSLPSTIPALFIEQGASALVQKNLFYSLNSLYLISTEKAEKPNSLQSIHIHDNLAVGSCENPLPGILSGDVTFADASHENFETSSEYGAHGWMTNLAADIPDLEKNDIPSDCENNDDEHVDDQTFAASYTNDEYENELLEKTFFFDASVNENTDEDENDDKEPFEENFDDDENYEKV